MKCAVILRGIGGFYDVAISDRVIRCKLRGRLRLGRERVLIGDHVTVTVLNDTEGVIESLKPRRNELRRPPISNVDQVVAVIAAASPEPDQLVLDKTLLLASVNRVNPVVCVNKADLNPEQAQRLCRIYEAAHYPVVVTSTPLDQGIAELRSLLTNKITAFSGVSGVGKSSLANALQEDFRLEVGGISDKLKRGRHTTRRVELLPLAGGGFVADTPGFTRLDLGDMDPSDVGVHFREIERTSPDCYFRGCLHDQEPRCAVKRLVGEGKIDRGRYENYLICLEEAKTHTGVHR